MKACRTLLLLFAVATGIGAEPAIEFSGVLAAGNETKVALSDKATGQTRWVKLGQEFSGYVAASYEPATETLVLVKDGTNFRVRMKGAAKVAGSAAAEPTPEMRRALLNNLRQLAAAADQYYLENGKTTTTLDELVGETKYVKRLNIIAGENYNQIVFKQGTALVITTASGYTMRYEP